MSPRLLAAPVIGAGEVGDALQNRLGGRHLVFNLSDMSAATALGEGSIALDIGWETSAPKLPTPTPAHLLRVVYCMHGWHKMDSANRIILACETGKTRSSIVAAAYLKYTGVVESCAEGLMMFYRACRPTINLTAGDIARKPLLEAFLGDTDTLLEAGQFPNPAPFTLAGVLLEGLHVEDLPEIELWSDGNRIFKSTEPRGKSQKCLWDYESMQVGGRSGRVPAARAMACRARPLDPAAG